MIFVYILAALLLLLGVLLLINVKVSVLFNENFDYELKFGLIRILSSGKKKADTTKKSQRNTKDSFEYFKKLKQKKGLSAAVCELMTYIKVIFSEMEYLISKLKINNFACRVIVAESDAASTAIMYGAVSAAVYSFVGFLHSLISLEIKEIYVKEDYESQKGDFEFSFAGKIRLLYLLVFAIKILIRLINKKDVLVWEKTALKV